MKNLMYNTKFTFEELCELQYLLKKDIEKLESYLNDENLSNAVKFIINEDIRMHKKIYNKIKETWK